MLARPITYTNFVTGEEVTETFYFNLSKPELLEMEVGVEGGLANQLQKIIDAKNGKELIQTFKRIILDAYGERSEDGRAFLKSEALKEKFSQTAAYHVLFMELSTDSEAAANFIKGAMPQDLAEEVEKEMKEQKTVTHDGRTTTVN